MGAITDRIAELGVEIPSQAAAPAGVYVPAVVSGSYVYTAGQLPFVDGHPAGDRQGRRGGHARNGQRPRPGQRINALAAVAAVIGSLDRVTRIVKVVGFVSSDPEFYGQAGRAERGL